MTTLRTRADAEHRHAVADHASLAGVAVREDDVEPVKGIRTIAVLFRGMAIILLGLMILQVFFAATSTVPLSVGVVTAEAVRLIIFAGLLWGAGDLAVLFVKSHYDLRATRILTARLAHLVLAQEMRLERVMDGRRSGVEAPFNKR